jgi:hypothetical protein
MESNHLSAEAICKILEFGREMTVDANNWNAEELTCFARAAVKGKTVVNVINHDCLSNSSLLSITNKKDRYVMLV